MEQFEPLKIHQIFEESIRSTWSFISGMIGVMLAVVAWIFKSDDPVPTWIFSIAILLSLWLCSICFRAVQLVIVRSKNILADVNTRNQIPSALKCLQVTPGGKWVLLLAPSPMFSHGIVVSIYVISDEYERYLAKGYVLNIQEDKKIQIVIDSLLVDDDPTYLRLQNNNASVLKSLRVKPVVQQDSFVNV